MPTAPVDHSRVASHSITVEQVGALDRGVLVLREALGRARASQVDATHHVSGGGQTLVLRSIGRGVVVLAVGEGLQDGGPRSVAVGDEERGGQPDAVGHRDVLVSLGGHVEGKATGR